MRFDETTGRDFYRTEHFLTTNASRSRSRERDVYGWINDTLEMKYIRGNPISEYGQFGRENETHISEPTIDFFTRYTHVFSDASYTSDYMIDFENLTEVVLALNSFMERFRGHFNLAELPLIYTYDRVARRVWFDQTVSKRGTNLTLHLEAPNRKDEIILGGRPGDNRIEFNLEVIAPQRRSFGMQVGGLADPFQGHYPIILIRQGAAERCDSFVSSFGYCQPLMMLENPDKILFSKRTRFAVDGKTLEIVFLDSEHRVIEFFNDYNAYICIDFDERTIVSNPRKIEYI